MAGATGAIFSFTFGLALLAACAPPPGPPMPSPASDAAEAPTPAPVPRSLPGPGPQTRIGSFDPITENEACERCHAEIAAEWRGSMHQIAWDDPLFISAYAIEPIAFCKNCHAPEIRPGFDGPDPSRHLGVACVTCHQLGDQILGATDMASPQHHAVTRSPQIEEAAWCSGCHEFAFPQPQPALMQSTVSEHQASRHAERSCVDCHMPLVGDPPRRSHAFSVLNDPELLRSAIAASAERTSPRSIAVAMQVTGAGHAVPTGDMFRQLEVRAWTAHQNAKTAVLAREFRKDEGASFTRRLQVADRRLPASGEARSVELVFTRPLDGPVEWEVVYHRMRPIQAQLFGIDLREEEVVLAQGTIEEGHSL